ncbi:MAG TPA: hypothetical protein VNJ47_09495 [Nevskiales bacterium]|nr:hypothetical protein [Nevskiales bacterium]
MPADAGMTFEGGVKMRMSILAISALCGSLTVVTSVRAADRDRGRALYENHCTSCHESVVHVREDRKVGSRGDLLKQITRWQSVLELQWTRADVDDVAEYLNRTFYKLQ